LYDDLIDVWDCRKLRLSFKIKIFVADGLQVSASFNVLWSRAVVCLVAPECFLQEVCSSGEMVRPGI